MIRDQKTAPVRGGIASRHADENVVHRVGVIMNGVTGRMGTNQHLMRSIMAIREQGGVQVSDHESIMPEPLLVGRNPEKLEQLAARAGVERFTTDLDAALADRDFSVYFDAQTTLHRAEAVKKAIAAGKHIYCEKPTASDGSTALELYRRAARAGVKHGVVQDKLWLPGLLKLKTLIDTGFFGRIFAVRGEFGYWVFDGDAIPAQRPSWNYKKDEGGGIIFDMFCHWHYVLGSLFGRVESMSCTADIHIPRRWDENGVVYETTAEDAAYATFRIAGGIIAHFNSSWEVRVRRDDLLTIQVDGTQGSAVAGLRECWIQPLGATPKPVWNPDVPQSIDFYRHWVQMPEQRAYDNAFKVQWELFLRHVVFDEPFRWGLLTGAEGVRFAELAVESWKRRAWVDVPSLETHQ
jgi:predicted dehydrogenase